eukprot:CAMPEP_0171496202 /NCGR_PEP_ID=MMETSP0958-20121227/6568_1 /TAXON_ID=87120 /ORGANISM="Aurantiochytrium limacinum, Strain ATCCMYA-1381" /LENGTH=690 /DNA_ID=CAMNT_0012030273 /DNA_START=438 /DNA_END=2510 /DNA_ORIENTATION=+
MAPNVSSNLVSAHGSSTSQRKLTVAAVLMTVAVAAVSVNGDSCTSTQLSCVSSAQSVLSTFQDDSSERPGAVCLGFTDAFAQLASCVGATGCDGADLSDSKAACLALNTSDSNCFVDCSAIATSLNALDDNADDAAACEFADYNNDTFGLFPGATFNGRQASTSLQSSSNGEVGSDFSTLWALSDEGLQGGAPVETTAGDLVVPTASNELICVDARGNELWTFTPISAEDSETISFVGQPIVTVRGEIVIGDENGILYRIDETSGDLVAAYNLGGKLTATPVASRDYIFASSRGTPGIASTLHKLSAVSDDETEASDAGLATWRQPVCDHNDTRLDWPAGALSLTSDGRVVLACTWNGYVDVYDGTTGELLSSTQVNFNSTRDVTTVGVYGPALIDANDAIYVTVPQGGLVKLLNETDGASIVYNETGVFDDDVAGNLAINSDLMVGYALDESGRLYSISLSNGTVLQSTSGAVADISDSTVVAPVIDASGNVAVAVGSKVVIFDSDLNQISSTDIGSVAVASPVIAQGTLLTSAKSSALTQVGSYLVYVPTSAPTQTPTAAPTVTDSPTLSPTAAPTTTNGEVPPTSAPTRAPTEPKDPEEPVDSDSGSSSKWPASAIAVVCILAILDAALLTAILIVAFRRKNDVATDAKDSKNYSNSQGSLPGSSPIQSTASSPTGAEAAKYELAQA